MDMCFRENGDLMHRNVEKLKFNELSLLHIIICNHIIRRYRKQ